MANTVCKPLHLDVELRADARGRVLCVRCGIRRHGETEELITVQELRDHLAAHAKIGHRVPAIPASPEDPCEDAVLAELRSDLDALGYLQHAADDLETARKGLLEAQAGLVALQAEVASIRADNAALKAQAAPPLPTATETPAPAPEAEPHP